MKSEQLILCLSLIVSGAPACKQRALENSQLKTDEKSRIVQVTCGNARESGETVSQLDRRPNRGPFRFRPLKSPPVAIGEVEYLGEQLRAVEATSETSKFFADYKGLLNDQ